ncbi:YdcF family protein [Photobacterium sp. DNB23_23_1]|uniref:YdcF family protein n=1 Tax=Photobacterium pectinilyticum TaxID=2906793 RepID=A0ABT1N316_9GAMM|nr:YdcF family protein [Photobacterium sp. ZSDE20]MCQ1059145.1 YdcF family protein [Photobacterium sp. ZSDE20]MDD1824376.1 YdcF family protein [Photobacterium sp. ZSDE20]
MPSSVHALATTVWNYHHLNHTLVPSDCIFVLCSNDIRVAEHAARLFLDGFAPYIVFSGGEGELTRGMYKGSEAEAFAELALDMGVPEQAILLEPQSTNTGENIQFTRELLEMKGLNPESLILVQKPFMERRAYATFQQNWPGKKVAVSSPNIDFDEYPNEALSYSDIINVMLGDLQRIKVYPSYGYSVEQEIPDEVWQAFEQLIELGFKDHLLA